MMVCCAWAAGRHDEYWCWAQCAAGRADRSLAPCQLTVVAPSAAGVKDSLIVGLPFASDR